MFVLCVGVGVGSSGGGSAYWLLCATWVLSGFSGSSNIGMG